MIRSTFIFLISLLLLLFAFGCADFVGPEPEPPKPIPAPSDFIPSKLEHQFMFQISWKESDYDKHLTYLLYRDGEVYTTVLGWVCGDGYRATQITCDDTYDHEFWLVAVTSHSAFVLDDNGVMCWDRVDQISPRSNKLYTTRVRNNDGHLRFAFSLEWEKIKPNFDWYIESLVWGLAANDISGIYVKALPRGYDNCPYEMTGMTTNGVVNLKVIPSISYDLYADIRVRYELGKWNLWDEFFTTSEYPVSIGNGWMECDFRGGAVAVAPTTAHNTAVIVLPCNYSN